MKPEIQDLTEPQRALQRDRLLRVIQILIVLFPMLVTLLYVHNLSVEAPYSDDWDLYLPLFHHDVTHSLTWSDVNSQHTESIVVAPLVLSLALTKVTGERLLPIIYLSYLFLCGALGVLFLFFRMLHLPGRWSVLWFLPASLLFLGWRQWEGLLWSTHLVNTMALFFVLSALYCCTQANSAPIFFPAAIACAWIASFSMASGLLVWISGAAALVAAGSGKTRFEEVLRQIVGWLVMGAVCAGSFFFDGSPHHVPWPHGISYVLANPVTAVRYTLTYLGGSLAARPLPAFFAGAALVLIALPILFLAIKRFRQDGVLPGLVIVSYVAFSLAPLLMGRLGLGVGQAFTSRYATLGALAPLGVYFCSLSLARTVPACRYLAAALVLLIVAGIFNSYYSGLADGRKMWRDQTRCAASVKDYSHIDRKVLICGYPDAGVIIERAPLLSREHLSLFSQ